MAKEEPVKKIERNEKPDRRMEKELETLVRIYGYDIPGSKNIYTGLTKIKGISWAIANAICIKLNLQKSKKVSEMSKDEIQKIETFIKEFPIPNFLKNRRFDPESGEMKHHLGTELDLLKEFDIKRLMKIKSYKGIRHSTGQPVRGQKTRSHFRSRKNKQAAGFKKVKVVKEVREK